MRFTGWPLTTSLHANANQRVSKASGKPRALVDPDAWLIGRAIRGMAREP
jgi:hypothetical protein